MSTSTSITPLTITGVSSMSSEWQTVLNRAVSIASLPLQQLQNSDTDVISKKALLADLSTDASTLGDALTKLGTLAAGKSLAASSSDTSAVTVQNTGATVASTYTISNVQSVASAAQATSTGFSSASGTQVSSTGSLRLAFGDDGKTWDINLTNNSIGGLRDAINKLGAGVTATVLTAGDQNYLSITADSTGAVKNFSLTDDPTGAATELLSTPNLGSDASFQLNGIPITRSNNVVNDVIDGVTFTLHGVPTSGTATLTLARDNSQLSSGISSFVSAYNAMVDKVGAQVGESAGLLSGDYVVRDIQTNLRSLASYQSDGTIKSLWEMGLSFGTDGKITFDTTTFNSLTDSQMQGALSFFGSTTTGFGALAQKFSALTDPISGSIKIEQDGLDQTDKSLQSQIQTLSDRINVMQTALQSRLQVADALLASLESQKTMLTSNIQSLDYVLYGKQTSSN
ncbi:MAG: flagellar filament capping protein FliD [Acidobacteria bacterium]|nr:flagellar filament capping protein FliD [Acidobacteriota bacterium]